MPVLNIRQINGVVRTSEPVWSNLERLAEAASVWFTYDTHEGVYGWVINQAGNSVAAISEADIIGPIQISGSGLTNMYNAVEVEYPRNDMNDQPHYVTLQLPDGLRNEYEPDNTLQMSSEFINNQPQAEYVGMVTLKQSRLDLTVTIVMDYTKINLEAGDIIDITSTTYGWTAKEFRIMRVRELEGDDGSLRLEFSCTEYDDTIYDGTWDNFLVAGTPGIRAIGAIGTPATPTIVVGNVNSLPTQLVTSTVPSGIVDRMQFWAGNVLITGNVANTDFNLVGSIASTDAASFTQSANVVFSSSSLQSGTWAWKSRGVNGLGTGPFSNVSANVDYVRNQVPDGLKPGTLIITDDGVEILPTLRADWRSSGIPDIVQSTSNSAYKGTVFTSDVTMIGSNGNIGVVSWDIPSPSPMIRFDVSFTGLVRDVVPAALGYNQGLAMYTAKADWDQAAYTANGFSGLNWSDWSWIGSVLDEGDGAGVTTLVTGNNFINIDQCFSFENDITANAYIIALGYTSTIVPQSGDFVVTVNPVSGITEVGYNIGFVGNTVIQNSVGNTTIYETPGISNVAIGSGTLSALGKIRIDR